MEFPSYETVPIELERKVEEFLDKWHVADDVEKIKLWSSLKKDILLLFKVHPHIEKDLLRISTQKTVTE